MLDLGGGVYAALAHLRRGSVGVRRGDRVAAGLPLRFDRFQVAGADQAGLPGNLQPFTASPWLPGNHAAADTGAVKETLPASEVHNKTPRLPGGTT